MSACPILAKEQYNKRHEILFSHTLTEEDRAKLGKKHWYGHLPMSQETSRENVLTILWFQQIKTYITFPDNKPDTIVHDSDS
jgi:hypothetical protein